MTTPARVAWVGERAPTVTPSDAEVRAVCIEKYGAPEQMSLAPRRWHRAGYVLPTDVYEATVARHVTDGTAWLDIGGGDAIFPNNLALSRRLAARSGNMIAVDPSANVLRNEFARERVHARLEEFAPGPVFDLATLRMVVEHVDAPDAFARALAGAVRPGGTVVIFTVNRWAPITLVSSAVPFRFHHALKRLVWGGDEEDTFPVCYLLNTRTTLQRALAPHGLREAAFARLDDLSTFGTFPRLGAVELAVWRAMRSIALPYPESCLLGIYVKDSVATPAQTPVREK